MDTMIKAKKTYIQPTPPECGESSLGLSPSVLAKRRRSRKENWCNNLIEFTSDYDPWCDPENPRTILYKDVLKAYQANKGRIPTTPLLKAQIGDLLDLNVYFKVETIHKTGSFHERSAIYVLHKLTPEQRADGVYTASLGNWALALSCEGQRMKIPVTVVLPVHCHFRIAKKCQCYGARVLKYGDNLAESRQKAFDMIREKDGVGTYINGYDHPHVIAGAGTIGIEILEQMDEVDAILVPVGGGGLIAGIATVVKELKPDVLIYGVEMGKSCCFFKALENEEPYKTDCSLSTGQILAVPTAGYNAFHTARSLIDKMVLVEDDWISRAILHYVENERFIAESAGAATLAAIFSVPNIVPELRNKNVICLLTGANIDNFSMPLALERAKSIEGRLITVKIKVHIEKMDICTKVLKIIANLGCNIDCYEWDDGWFTEEELNYFYMIMRCETRGFLHTCTFKRVLDNFFPDVCEFSEEAFNEKSVCPCFPKLWPPCE